MLISPQVVARKNGERKVERKKRKWDEEQVESKSLSWVIRSAQQGHSLGEMFLELRRIISEGERSREPW